MPRWENLTIMFTDIVGYTARTSEQSRTENHAMLRDHDRLLLPIVAAFGGRRVKSIGDALLVTFRSPTNAVKCGMALQDAIAEYNRAQSVREEIHIRVAINLGETRMERGDIFGEPVNTAARIEGVTPPDEVYFSESVYLAMTRAEVHSEAVGQRQLKGIKDPVELYRVVRMTTELPAPDAHDPDRTMIAPPYPFGGMHLGLPIARARGLRLVIARPVVLAALAVGAVLVVLIAASVIRAAVRPSSNARAILSRGHDLYRSGDRRAAIAAYDRALDLDDDLADDPQLITNLVDALSWSKAEPKALLIQHATDASSKALRERASRKGYWGRQRAIEILREVKEDDDLDGLELQIAILDLDEGPDCSHRRQAANQLRELGDPRALPVLKSAASGFNGISNACVASEIDAAIKKIEE